MKKLLIFVLVLSVLALGAITPTYAHSSNVDASVSKLGREVTISGITSTGGKVVTLFVTNPNGDVSYINQKTAESDGSFKFVFDLTQNVVYVTYTASIGGSGSLHKTLTFEHTTDDDEYEFLEPDEIVVPNASDREYFSNRLFMDADLIATVNNYVPVISGTIRCEQGTTAGIKVTNKTDNTIIAEETFEYSKNAYEVSYTLPSLLSSKDYNIFIYSTTVHGTWVDITADIDSSIILIDLAGRVEKSKTTVIDAGLKTVNSEYVDKSITITDNRNISIIIPNIISNSSYNLKVKGYESYGEGAVRNILSNENPGLYNALKAARPELDNDGDGIITRSELSSIKGVLNLGQYGIESLAGMDNCTNLTGLIVSGNKIKSLRPLSNLKKLEYLDARNNRISNMSTMPESLRYLNIDNNLVEGLEGLKNANNLEYLSASGNKINSALGIGRKLSLRYLNLSGNNMTDIMSVLGCFKLVHIDLSNNSITDRSPTYKLKNTYYLDFSGNE